MTEIFIVLEGCDNTGKTTLARRLCSVAEQQHMWDTEVWHRGVPVRHPLEEYIEDIDTHYAFRDLSASRTLIVADRWHLGQIVYGGLYREKENRNLLDDRGIALVNEKLASIGALIYILNDDLDTLVARELAGKEETWQTSKDAGYLQTEHFGYVRTKYLNLATEFHIPVLEGPVSDECVKTMLVDAEAAHELAVDSRMQPSSDLWKDLL